MASLSWTEQEFAINCAQNSLRLDGRGTFDLRPFDLDVNVAAHTNGSARVRVGQHTDVLVGLKLEIVDAKARSSGDAADMTADPQEVTGSEYAGGDSSQPQAEGGFIEVHVDCSPLASADVSFRDISRMNLELSRSLRRILMPSRSLPSLVVVPGHSVWAIYLDVLVLQTDGGNLLDPISIATRAALLSCRVPKISVSRSTHTGAVEIEILSTEEGTKLDLPDVPVFVSAWLFNQTASQTRSATALPYLFDAAAEEAAFSVCRITSAVSCGGAVSSVSKPEGGLISMDLLEGIINHARVIGSRIISELDRVVSEAERRHFKRPVTGIL